ncbi:MAG: TonB family protein / TonB-dependent receptor [Myxococcaceae bacterium]|nr:TonB family protein / TonB-dependent receptor [Myxococcaceae bacterium]
MRLATLLIALFALAARAQDAGVLVPPQLLTDSPARYPADAGVAPREVTLELTVDEAGDVTHAQVIETDAPVPAAFGREAVHAAVRLHFAPATLDGQPRAVRLRFSYLFHPPQPAVPRAAIAGQVRARGNRQPIPFATLTSDDGATTQTDEQGNFRLEVTPGQRTLRGEAAAFVADSFEETLAPDSLVTVVYTLRPTQVNPYQTVVRADRVRTEVARVELHDAEIREVPGTFGDPFKVVMLMPGVASIASGAGYPVVRGSSPASTGYFLDGVRVPQLFHVFLGPAIIHPDFIESIDFYAGGAPVRYGRLLGGAVEGRLAKPRAEGIKASAYVDLINTGLLVEIPIPATDTQITLGGRISYAAPIIAAASSVISVANSPKVIANFWDYQARIEQGVAGGKLRLFAFGSSDDFGSEANPADPNSVSTMQTLQFHRVDLRYRHPLGLGEAELAFTYGDDLISVSSSGPFFPPGKEDVVQLPLGVIDASTTIYQRSFAGRTQWSAELSDTWAATVRFEVEEIHAGFGQSTRVVLTAAPDAPREFSQDDPAARATLTSGSLELAWMPEAVPRLRVVPGLRYDHWFLRPNFTVSSVDPRVAAFFDASDRLELHGSVGGYHQAPTFLISVPVVDVASVRLGLQEAVQTSVGAKWRLWRDLELSADAYVNVIARSVEVGIIDDEALDTTDLDPSHPPRPKAKPTHGQAWGVEAMLRWPQKGRFFGWLTASLSRSQRRLTFPRLGTRGQTIGSASGDLPYAFDQTFIANMVLSYRFDSGISVGATLHFNTGRPESGELTSRTRFLYFDKLGGPHWARVSQDQAERLPPYFRLDVRVAKTWLTDQLSIELYLDVLNVLFGQEVLGYAYPVGTTERFPTRFPIVIPNLGLKVRY